jgi:transcriptional regulator with XRE-family HTH domain
VSLIEAEPRVSGVIQQLVAERHRQHMSASALARELHTRASAVSEWESGVVSPTLRMLERWAQVLGLVVAAAESPTRMPAFARLEPAPVEDPALARNSIRWGAVHG